MTPIPDIVDDDNDHYVAPPWKGKWQRRQPPLVAWTSPGQRPMISHSCGHNHNSFSGGPTRYEQSLKTSPPDGGVAR